MSAPGGGAASVSRPRFELADIMRAQAASIDAQFHLDEIQLKAVRDLTRCRTAVLGGHLDVCRDCGHERPAYNSCRNRHCPKCQSLAQAEWLARQEEKLLSTGYFHLVFTLPSELRSLARRSPEEIYDLLFRAASDTLLTLGRDPQRLGGLLGITAVLHTWRRDLCFHPHLHCVVPGGALQVGDDDRPRWIDAGRRYLFPVRLLSKLFRGKFLAGLVAQEAKGALDVPPELTGPGAFQRYVAQLGRIRWLTYCKRPFAGPAQVFKYLGRYTHRVGLSNNRILHADDEAVTIATREGKAATMTPLELVRRFLMHVLPKGYVKIRHYGLLAASNLHGRLLLARAAIEGGAVVASVPKAPADWRARLLALTGQDLACCPVCGGGQLLRITALLPGRWTSARAPP